MMSDRPERKRSSAFKRRHKRVTVSLDENQLVWLDDRVNERLFHSRSHGLEVAIRTLRQQDTKKEKVV
jgi:Arc/MetJ-type ribon-helix-helix transcriptional regulator